MDAVGAHFPAASAHLLLAKRYREWPAGRPSWEGSGLVGSGPGEPQELVLRVGCLWSPGRRACLLAENVT